MLKLEAPEDLFGDSGMDGNGVSVERLRLDTLCFPICAAEIAPEVVVLELFEALFVELSSARRHAAEHFVQDQVYLVPIAALGSVALA